MIYGREVFSKKYWNIKNPMGDTADKDYDDLLNLTIGDPDLTRFFILGI